MAESAPISLDPTSDRIQAQVEPMDAGRLGVYAALGASAGSVPLPWVTDVLVRQVRGALLHDVAVRRGVSLTPEARDVLADPQGPAAPRGFAAQALRFLGARLAVRVLTSFGPGALLWSLRGALRTYALGRLFDRYLARGRPQGAVRIDVEEARRVRKVIDAAMAHAMTTSAGLAPEPTVIDDQRDATTALIDAALGFAARVPSWMTRRLDVAFDEVCRAEDAG
jgi:hypothetical protein